MLFWRCHIRIWDKNLIGVINCIIIYYTPTSYSKKRQLTMFMIFLKKRYTSSRLNFGDIFWSGRCLRFISPFERFYEKLKDKYSLSLYLLPFTLALSIWPLSLYHISLCFRHHCVSLFSPSFSLAHLMDVFFLVWLYLIVCSGDPVGPSAEDLKKKYILVSNI